MTYHCETTRKNLKSKYNLTDSQELMIFNGYCLIEMSICQLTGDFRKNRSPYDLRVCTPTSKRPLPRIPREILINKPADFLYQYFNPMAFKEQYESFFKKCIKHNIKTGEDVWCEGVVMYAPDNIQVQSYDFNYNTN